MSKLNTAPTFNEKTHEGAPAARMTLFQALRRSVLSCLLWEKEFYEDGESVADRIVNLCLDERVSSSEIGYIAMEARHKFNLRHVPLLLVSALVKKRELMKAAREYRSIIADVIESVVKRADELAELLVIHTKVNGVAPSELKRILSAQMKKGLASAFGKFDAYQLAKYDRPGAVRLRDVLFLCHAKPKDEEQAALWKQLIDGTLPIPDTWETQLSAGKDKKETFERLIREDKLGYLALLRNLRNMQEAGCDSALIKEAIRARKGAGAVLPFRYIAAVKSAPQFADALNDALIASVADEDKLPGKTIVLVDISPSMDWKLSEKSDLTRIDAACALASIIPCEEKRVFSFSSGLAECPSYLGLPGIAAIKNSQERNGTLLGKCIQYFNDRASLYGDHRIIVISDEQSQDPVPVPKMHKAYMINVASSKNGIGYGKWTHIDGFSESVIRFIRESENAIDE